MKNNKELKLSFGRVEILCDNEVIVFSIEVLYNPLKNINKTIFLWGDADSILDLLKKIINTANFADQKQDVERVLKNVFNEKNGIKQFLEENNIEPFWINSILNWFIKISPIANRLNRTI